MSGKMKKVKPSRVSPELRAWMRERELLLAAFARTCDNLEIAESVVTNLQQKLTGQLKELKRQGAVRRRLQ